MRLLVSRRCREVGLTLRQQRAVTALLCDSPARGTLPHGALHRQRCLLSLRLVDGGKVLRHALRTVLLTALGCHLLARQLAPEAALDGERRALFFRVLDLVPGGGLNVRREDEGAASHRSVDEHQHVARPGAVVVAGEL